MADHDRDGQVSERRRKAFRVVEIDQKLDVPAERRDAPRDCAQHVGRHDVARLAPVHHIEAQAAHAGLVEAFQFACRDVVLHHGDGAQARTGTGER